MPVKNSPLVHERRRSLRAERVVAIRHRLAKRQSSGISGSWSLSTTRNMSASGLLFLSDTPYIAGDTVELSVVISGVIDIVKGCAKVVRVTESGNKTFDVAVKLIPEKSKSRSAKAHR